ncbi:hypothetical protein NLJ89_g4372 [Agrocybe chaxingu]|uniref:Uncharacterized protein n=1 Tax=Agrocybe chaxingu TaxID=84603 RepID=A0A9W8K2T7_9AGAR|nr:hypothetical protein NLJ89_g4372 [Agrocybe chaxingu]
MPVRRISKSSYARSKKSHARLDSCQTPLMPYLHRDANVQQQASDSTLSAKSSPRNRLRPTRSQSSVSEEGFQSDAPSYNNSDFLPMNSGQPESDRELGGFVDRFRHLISQITRETEEGLAFARSDGSSSSRNTRESPPPQSSSSSSEIDVENAHRHPDFHYDDDDDFYTSSSPRAVPSGNYHQPYPEDEHIHMMNGIVRRMPTIQSLGSREMRSSMGASSTHTNRDRAPTRNTVISWSGTDLSIGSEPARSRPNSLTAQAELLAGMFGKMHASEIGELLRRENTVRMVDSGSLSIPDDISEALPEYDSTTSGTSGSKATTDSFHTASSGGTQNSMTRALKDAVKSPMELPAHLQAGRGENEEPER